MSKIQMLTSLRAELLTFLDQLTESFPEEGDLIVARFLLADKIPISDIMEYIIHTLLPLKTMVKNRDENFFLEHNILFEEIDSGKVNHFKRIWKSDALDDEDKTAIWKWFDRFLIRAERYKNLSQ